MELPKTVQRVRLPATLSELAKYRQASIEAGLGLVEAVLIPVEAAECLQSPGFTATVTHLPEDDQAVVQAGEGIIKAPRAARRPQVRSILGRNIPSDAKESGTPVAPSAARAAGFLQMRRKTAPSATVTANRRAGMPGRGAVTSQAVRARPSGLAFRRGHRRKRWSGPVRGEVDAVDVVCSFVPAPLDPSKRA